MTEDDTFKALRKVSYEQARADLYEFIERVRDVVEVGDATDPAFIAAKEELKELQERICWTHEEVVDERHRREDAIDPYAKRKREIMTEVMKDETLTRRETFMKCLAIADREGIPRG